MTGTKSTRSAWSTLAVGAILVATTSLLTAGCSIRTQAPIKEVAYDFSDRDFYDRGYAASPQYAELEPVYVSQSPLPRGSDAGRSGEGHSPVGLSRMGTAVPPAGVVAGHVDPTAVQAGSTAVLAAPARWQPQGMDARAQGPTK